MDNNKKLRIFKIIVNAALLGGAIGLIGHIWQALEEHIYGGVQPRIVDNIVTILWIVLAILAYVKGYYDARDRL